MALKTRISKADFDALADILKTEYIPEGDGYKLDADYEDVTGLKAKRDELLAETKRLKDLAKGFEGLDPEAARKAIAAAQAAEDERLKANGEFETLTKQLKDRHEKELEAANSRASAIISNLRREKIATLAISKGVKPERVRSAIAEGDLDSVLDLNETDFSIRTKEGIGDAKDVDAVFDALKARADWLFAADTNPGSGASGSGNGSSNANAKTWTRSQWDAADSNARSEFAAAKGVVTD